MEINLDDLKRILTDGRLAVSLAGATCIHCNVVSRTIESAAEHDASCEKHPTAARIAELEATLAESEERWIEEREAWIRQKAECVTLRKKLAEAREDSARLDWLFLQTHGTSEQMHLGLRAAIDIERGRK